MGRAEDLFERVRHDGEAAIDRFIADFESESLWLDFKQSADSAGAALHKGDREGLARAISGFANSDGGVVVWGVDCRRDAKTGADLPLDKHPLEKPHRFISWLEGALSGCVTPPAPRIEHVAVMAAGGSSGFIATLIPQSELAPHQCIQPANKPQYLMRAGSSFVAVPHAVLAGMFGRRPQPKLFTLYEGQAKIKDSKILEISVQVGLVNHGPAPAAGAYLSFRVLVERPNCGVSFKPRMPEHWTPHQSFDKNFSVIATPMMRLAPHAPAYPVQLIFRFSPPFNDRYVFELHFGCEDAEPAHVLREYGLFQVSQAYARAVEILRGEGPPGTVDEILSLFLSQSTGTA